MTTTWNRLFSCPMPFLASVHEQVAKLFSEESTLLPSLDSTSIYIASDYSGSPSKYDFDVISMVIADFTSWTRWESHRQTVRAKYFEDCPSRRMSFKDLGDGYRRAALEPFLEAAGQLNGLCITFAVRKDVRGIFDLPDSLEVCRPYLSLKADWKQKSFSKMLAIVQIVSFLVSALSTRGQDILWITDEDDIIANKLFKADVLEMLSRTMSTLCVHELGELGFATTALEDERMGLEDFVAIADLAVGATAEGMTAIERHNGLPLRGELRLPTFDGLSSKTKLIWNWLRPGQSSLKKLNCIVRPYGRNDANLAEVVIAENVSFPL